MYEQFGLLLLRMGDDLQGGKFLLLSGKRRPEYEAPVALFLERYSHAGWQNLLAEFPAAARRCSWSELPSQVRTDLEAAGVPQRPHNELLSSTPRPYRTEKLGWAGLLLILLVLSAVGFVLAVLVVHFYYGV